MRGAYRLLASAMSVFASCVVNPRPRCVFTSTIYMFRNRASITELCTICAHCTSINGAHRLRAVGELPAYCAVKVQSDCGVTPTVKLTEPVPTFPALSVALAEKLLFPSTKLVAVV